MAQKLLECFTDNWHVTRGGTSLGSRQSGCHSPLATRQDQLPTWPVGLGLRDLLLCIGRTTKNKCQCWPMFAFGKEHSGNLLQNQSGCPAHGNLPVLSTSFCIHAFQVLKVRGCLETAKKHSQRKVLSLSSWGVILIFLFLLWWEWGLANRGKLLDGQSSDLGLKIRDWVKSKNKRWIHPEVDFHSEM